MIMKKLNQGKIDRWILMSVFFILLFGIVGCEKAYEREDVALLKHKYGRIINSYYYYGGLKADRQCYVVFMDSTETIHSIKVTKGTYMYLHNKNQHEGFILK